MKNMMSIFGILGIGMAGYIMVNKRMRKQAEELFNTMIDEADKTLKNMSN